MNMTNEQIRAQYPETAERIIGERAVIRRLVTEALKRGLTVSINDGEEWALKHSVKLTEVMSAIMSTDEDYLRLCNADKSIAATFHLIYGNSPEEVIADCSTNALANELCAIADR
jgi:hypothetical protein